MKFLIFSDLHGSLPAARTIKELFLKELPDAVLLLGDLLYHGPRNPLPEGYNPSAVAEELAPIAGRIIAVRGNCDSEVDAQVLPFPLIPDCAWVFAHGLRICMTHGHAAGPENLPPLVEGDMLLSGHTHVPSAQSTSDGILLCNPGSLSLPKEDHPPSYAMLHNSAFSVFTPQGELYLRLEGL